MQRIGKWHNNLNVNFVLYTFQYAIEPIDRVLNHGGRVRCVHVVPDALVQGIHTCLTPEEFSQTTRAYL